MKILAIGDPHLKKDNGNETSLMINKLKILVLDEQPDMIVILGDIGHDFEEIGINRHVRIHDLILTLHDTMPINCKLFLLIGNHDRVNNKIFMTSEHTFNSYKKWTNTYVVDYTHVEVINNKKYVFVPYVETGRFNEALAAKNLAIIQDNGSYEYNMDDVVVIFAHQEFYGAKMNAITSNKGDVWPSHLPLCISGHIHDYEQLQNNIIYVGTPIQHGYSDTKDKTVSIFNGDNLEHKRINLNIPKKLKLTLDVNQLKDYQPPPNANIKIKVRGTAEEIKNVMSSEHVNHLKEIGVKIIEDVIIQKLIINNNITKKSFQDRLIDNMNYQPENYKQIFFNIFS